jgi:hypothetical protein
MLVRTGTGFQRVTALGLLAEESAALVAEMVTVFGEGRVAGAVYFPEGSMTPRADEPPLVPFTDQLRAEFEVPVTEAEKVCEALARILAAAGVTRTVTEEVGGGAGFFAKEEFPLEAQDESRNGKRMRTKAANGAS